MKQAPSPSGVRPLPLPHPALLCGSVTVLAPAMVEALQLERAQGDVLEISAGTGRNMPYWRWDRLSSLTVTDTSRFMLFHAKQKVAPAHGSSCRGRLCMSTRMTSFGLP